MLAPTRRRDLRSAIKRVADLLGEDLARIKLDLPSIGAQLAAINPAGVGLSPKRWSNLRSDFLAAVRESGLRSSVLKARQSLSPEWQDQLARADKRTKLGLSRLARFASASGIDPGDIDDAAIEGFITTVREGSLHRKPKDLHRSVALIWNEVAAVPGLNLKPVTVPSFRRPAKRIDWKVLPESFSTDVDTYLN